MIYVLYKSMITHDVGSYPTFFEFVRRFSAVFGPFHLTKYEDVRSVRSA